MPKERSCRRQCCMNGRPKTLGTLGTLVWGPSRRRTIQTGGDSRSLPRLADQRGSSWTVTGNATFPGHVLTANWTTATDTASTTCPRQTPSGMPESPMPFSSARSPCLRRIWNPGLEVCSMTAFPSVCGHVREKSGPDQPVSQAGRPTDTQLHDHAVAPLAIQTGVPEADPDFAEPQTLVESPARGIPGKEARHEFPEPARPTRANQAVKRHRSNPKSPGIMADIDRELSDPAVPRARTVRADTRPGHHQPVSFHNDRWVAVTSFGETCLHLTGGPWDRQEGRRTVLDSLIADLRNRLSIAQVSQTHRVRAI